MKTVIYVISGILAVVGISMVALSTIVAIGNGLYVWANGLEFAQAAWNGFVIWIKMLGSGLAIFSIFGIIYKVVEND